MLPRPPPTHRDSSLCAALSAAMSHALRACQLCDGELVGGHLGEVRLLEAIQRSPGCPAQFRLLQRRECLGDPPFGERHTELERIGGHRWTSSPVSR